MIRRRTLIPRKNPQSYNFDSTKDLPLYSLAILPVPEVISQLILSDHNHN